MNIDFQRVNIEIFAKRTRQQIRELKQALMIAFKGKNPIEELKQDD